MSLAFPEVIPKTRTVTLGSGERLTRETFPLEVKAQSLADVRSFIRYIVAEQTAVQIRLGNPPTVVEVDNSTSRRVDDVDKKVVVLYGTQLAGVAMRLVETLLASAIAASTNTHTGRLRSVTSSWGWLFVPKGGAARRVSSGQALPTFALGDVLVLMPLEVPYSTITNRNVARSGRIQVRKPRKGRAARRDQNLGFLAAAARAAQRRPEFKQFVVMADFTRAHMVPGEVMTAKQGTGYIKIRPRFRQRLG